MAASRNSSWTPHRPLSRHLVELTIQVADEATRTMTVQVEETAQRFNQAA